jgi:hypothetical protein
MELGESCSGNACGFQVGNTPGRFGRHTYNAYSGMPVPGRKWMTQRVL